MENLNHKKEGNKKEIELMSLYKDATDYLYENRECIKTPPPHDSDIRLRNLNGVFELGRQVYDDVNPSILKSMERKRESGHIKLGKIDRFYKEGKKIRIAENQNEVEAAVVLGHELGHAISRKDYFDGLEPMREIPSMAVEMEVAEHIKRLGLHTDSCVRSFIESLMNMIKEIKAETDAITERTTSDTPKRWQKLYVADILPYYFGALFSILRSEKFNDLVPLESLLTMRNGDVMALTKQMTQSKKCVKDSINRFLERSLS